MKPAVAAKMLVAAAGSLLLASGAAAQSANAPAAPAVQKVSVKGVARFDFDKSMINAEDGAKIMTEVRSMKNVTWHTISVIGHTDSVGPDSYNQGLSDRRAQAVREYLVGRGVKPERIKTDAKGESSPVASNKTVAGRAMNRRSEIEFQGVQSVAQ